MDQSLQFRFEYSKNRFLNWRDISSIELSRITNGDLAPIHRNIEDLAFVDLKMNIQDPSNSQFSELKISEKFFKIQQVLQFGMQYLLKYQS